MGTTKGTLLGGHKKISKAIDRGWIL